LDCRKRWVALTRFVDDGGLEIDNNIAERAMRCRCSKSDGKPGADWQGYQVIVPEARPINNISGRSWEGSGVIPDVRAGDDPMFAVRQMMAEMSAKASVVQP
jgi:hypothetical protein